MVKSSSAYSENTLNPDILDESGVRKARNANRFSAKMHVKRAKILLVGLNKSYSARHSWR